MSMAHAGSTSIVWSCTLHAVETSNRTDSVTIGEAADATDGPSADAYDVVKPPAPPVIPYLRMWLNDNLTVPYDMLWEDFRQYPGAAKTWNVTVQWMPQDYVSSTTVTLTWDPTEINASEYTTVQLCTAAGEPLRDIRLQAAYVFTCPAMVPQTFQIVCRANHQPYTPSDPTPANASTSQPVTPSLQWTGGDPDGDLVTYDVCFGDTLQPGKNVTNQSRTTFTPSPLDSDTRYYWRIVAWDSQGASTTGPLWSFTTQSSHDGSDGGSSNGSSENEQPTAMFSVNPATGFVGDPLVFNASASHDPDGYITGWSWVFGDGATGTGETIIHRFYTSGEYTVRLQVVDNRGGAADESLIVRIGTGNHPPAPPLINGPVIGMKQMMYSFTVTSTDADNDSLRYLVHWGDQTQNNSALLPNGTAWTVSHSWAYSGKYLISATAADATTMSNAGIWAVYINVTCVGDLGFFFDANGDEVVDSFHENATGVDTTVQRLSNGSLLFSAGSLQYLFNPSTGALVAQGSPSLNNDALWEFIAILALVIGVIAVIVYAYLQGFF